MAIARNVSSMWSSVKSAYGSVGREVQRSAVSSGESASKYLKAAETLLERHENGKVRIHGKLQNIRGDFTRLLNGDGITAEEDDLLALYWRKHPAIVGVAGHATDVPAEADGLPDRLRRRAFLHVDARPQTLVPCLAVDARASQ